MVKTITFKAGSLPDIVKFGVIDQLRLLELKIYEDLKTSDCEGFKFELITDPSRPLYLFVFLSPRKYSDVTVDVILNRFYR